VTPARRERGDVRRRRALLLQAAAAELRAGRRLEMQRLARVAGVSRSTVHRHFGSVRRAADALVEAAMERAEPVLRDACEAERTPLGQLRSVTIALVELGAEYGLAGVDVLLLSSRCDRAAELLMPLAGRVLNAAEIDSPPPDWLHVALMNVVVRALQAPAGSDPRAAAESLFRSLTEPLDRGLVALDPDGYLLAANSPARDALALGIDSSGDGKPISPSNAHYEDGSPSPPDAHPLVVALATGQRQPPTVRAHRLLGSGDLRWFVVHTIVLRLTADQEPYGIVGVLVDVTEERRDQLGRLAPPGTLGSSQPLILDVARVLDRVPPHLLPEQVVAEARRLVQVPVALYVVDIDGSRLLRLAGAEQFPARLKAPLALGPELAPDGIPELRARLAAEMPGLALAPMWLRGRAVGVLLAAGGSEQLLTEVARQGAAALELGNGYTDSLDAARRHKDINPAAELQQSLLPPRIVHLASADIAASVLPAYEVGGDWFDYVENRDGAWLAIADASGKGVHAGALGSIGLAALRAARRNDAELGDAVNTIHETISDAGEEDFFLTAIIARWSAVHHSFSWINAGHPPPLLVRPEREVELLASEPDLPLGLLERERRFRSNHRRVAPGERIVLYTDGISRRPTPSGPFGVDGIVAAIQEAPESSASATARAIQSAVVAATDDLLRDDAAVVVFAPEQAA
jgi:serine phosphatase RsbU (regulator of sigma subunit)/AcrR family transcriptional regulator